MFMSVKGAEGCRLRLNFGAHPLLILCHLCELQQVESAKLSSSLSSPLEKWNADGLKKKMTFLINLHIICWAPPNIKFVQLSTLQDRKHKPRLCKQLQSAFKVLHCTMNRTWIFNMSSSRYVVNISKVQGLVRLTTWQDANDKRQNMTKYETVSRFWQDC